MRCPPATKLKLLTDVQDTLPDTARSSSRPESSLPSGSDAHGTGCAHPRIAPDHGSSRSASSQASVLRVCTGRLKRAPTIRPALSVRVRRHLLSPSDAASLKRLRNQRLTSNGIHKLKRQRGQQQNLTDASGCEEALQGTSLRFGPRKRIENNKRRRRLANNGQTAVVLAKQSQTF